MTLIELLLVIVVLAIVGTAVGRILITSFRVSRDQMVQADMQSNVRLGGLALPLELREIGYDSSIVTNAVTSDIEAVGTDWVQFRAMRGIGYTCAISAGLTEFRVFSPMQGYRNPVQLDGFLLYVENDPNTGVDDQWLPLSVTNIDYASTCGADPAISFTVTVPDYYGPDLTASQVKVGGPIRFYERMRFGRMVDADGMTYMGARSISQGDASYLALAGPVDPVNGIGLRYYRRDGIEVAAAAVNPNDIRTIDITLRGLTSQAVNLAGTLPRGNNRMLVQTRVALRNTLRH